MLIACTLFCRCSNAGVNDDRNAVAQRLGAEIASHSFKKVYVADFLDVLGVRIDKGCYFASVFSTLLAEQKQNFAVVNRIEGQSLLTKAEFITIDLPKLESPAKVGAATGADAIVTGTYRQDFQSIVLEISLREVPSGNEIFHTRYAEQATDEFEALFPAALDSTGTIYLFAGLDGIGQPKCLTCPPFSAATSSGEKSASGQLFSAVFSADGKLKEARVVRSADPASDQALMEALKDWKIEPAKDASGAAVPVRWPIKMSAPSPDSATIAHAGINGVSSPQCIYCPQPNYSDKARKAHLEGIVVLDIVVLPDGSVTHITVLKGPGSGLEDNAIDAVRGWKMKPATTKDGTPVAARVNVEVSFHLDKNLQ
jgi:TonB family protein